VTGSPDARRVPAREGKGEVREKGSRFFGVAARAGTAEEAEEFLRRLRREHHDATHVAFAWKIGAGAEPARRASDAGEPSGTAGKPIALGIDASNLDDVVVAVVRYFGGTRLGTGGLARAYRQAAACALAACGSETVYDVVRLEARPAFGQLSAVRRLIRKPDVVLLAERFEPDPVLELAVRRSQRSRLESDLTEARVPFRALV
jgi:uncharacterized YigZ family protein